MTKIKKLDITKDVDSLVNEADVIIENTVKKINYDVIKMYWDIGKIITKYKESNDSKYGDAVIKQFRGILIFKYGSGFNKTNLYYAIKFYKLIPNFPLAGNLDNLTWTHLREILNISKVDQIGYYIDKANSNKLTKDEIRSAIKSRSYERTISHQHDDIKHEIEKALKDPIILNIENKLRTEKELEQEIFNNVFSFKKELGNKVMLYERQYKININGLFHKVDFVFHDYETDAFILIDLKIRKVTNRDIMQMKLYIKYFKDELDSKTNVIGLILCETKDIRVELNDDIYQIKYLNELPKDEELTEIISQNKVVLLKTEKLKLGMENC